MRGDNSIKLAYFCYGNSKT